MKLEDKVEQSIIEQECENHQYNDVYVFRNEPPLSEQAINFELDGKTVLSLKGDGTIYVNPSYTETQVGNLVFERLRVLWNQFIDSKGYK